MEAARSRLWIAAALLLLAGGCAETTFLAETLKRLRGGEAPEAAGLYRLGLPYKIGQVWYYPRVDEDYDETGVAARYAPGFHGKKTANGETHDGSAAMAAHRTLPLPSVARIVNLENGRAAVVRINDRGPRAPGRIVELSQGAARLLGLGGRRAARVRVRLLREESRAAVAAAKAGRGPGTEDAPAEAAPAGAAPAPPAVPVAAVVAEDPAPGAGPRRAAPSAVALARAGRGNVAEDRPVGPTALHVRVAAFAGADNARRLAAELESLGAARVHRTTAGGRPLFQVRIGPLADVARADSVLEKAIARGYPGARIVVDYDGSGKGR